MIKFFRNIRRKLLIENNFTKYFLYVIGEIVLVVIGILIALQINNANENRKAEKRTKQLLINVQKELALNIKNANDVIDFYRGKDSIIYKVLNKKLSYNDYKTSLNYSSLLCSNPDGYIVDNAFKIFIDSHSLTSIEQDSIIIELKELYGVDKKNVDDSDEQMEQLALDFLKMLSEKEGYYKLISFGDTTDEIIEYFLTEPLYLNKVSDLNLYGIQNHFIFTLFFRNKSINLYKKISEMLNFKKDSTIVKNVKDYEHYIGTYNAESLYTIRIKKEQNDLVLYNYNQGDSTAKAKTKLFTDSKTYFTHAYHFGCLEFDKNNEVIGFTLSRGQFRIEFKKEK